MPSKKTTPTTESTISNPRYRKTALALSGLLLLGSISTLVWLNSTSTNLPSVWQQTKTNNKSSATTATGNGLSATDSNSIASLSAEEQQLGANLQQRYGKKLDHPYWRLQTIEALKRYLMEKYPYDWLAKLKTMLKILFPEHYEQLLASLNAIESYNDWMAQLKHSMTFNSPEERTKAIWDKRLQLFGEDAKVIWQAQVKQEKVTAVLQQLDQSNLPLNSKIDRYVQTLKAVYGTEATDPEKSHPVQQMQGLLTLNSVQEQLHSMPPEQRQQELRHLRKAIGLDEAALKRWDELDAERNQRASAGQSYMQERAALEKQYQGDTLKLHIQALQIRKFGAEEAQYIRNEEETGFFRYQQRQQIGIN